MDAVILTLGKMGRGGFTQDCCHGGERLFTTWINQVCLPTGGWGEVNRWEIKRRLPGKGGRGCCSLRGKVNHVGNQCGNEDFDMLPMVGDSC